MTQPDNPASATMPFKFACEQCGAVIQHGDGYVEYDAYQFAGFTGWRALHRVCDLDMASYTTVWVPVADLADWGDIQAREDHLSQKYWWHPGHWEDLLDRNFGVVSAENSGRLM